MCQLPLAQHEGEHEVNIREYPLGRLLSDECLDDVGDSEVSSSIVVEFRRAM